MSTTIAKYYSDELDDWENSIDFYDQEALELGMKLAEVIERDSIPHIADRVEEQQGKIDLTGKKFKRLALEIIKQRNALMPGNSLIDDEFINAEIEEKQALLRRRMKQTEKQYIDSKYACADFLSGILKKNY